MPLRKTKKYLMPQTRPDSQSLIKFIDGRSRSAEANSIFGTRES